MPLIDNLRQIQTTRNDWVTLVVAVLMLVIALAMARPQGVCHGERAAS